MRHHSLLVPALALGVLTTTAGAQQRHGRAESKITAARASAADRAALGLHTGSGGTRDTLGVLIVGIVPGGPAEKAGLEEGHRIAAINGVNLRLAAADAGEPDMHGVTTRRLHRELHKVKPGDEVELRVYAGGQWRTAKVKTVAVAELPGREAVVRVMTHRTRDADHSERPVLGLQLSATGSRRDTLGVFVASVAPDGPAEKAGVVEGARIAAINDVDLRIAREDAGDPAVAGVKINRFRRAMRAVQPGSAVTLRVWANGQYRTVQVTAAKAGDVYKESRAGVFISGGELEMPHMMPMPRMAPMAPMPPMPAMPSMLHFEEALEELDAVEHVDEAMDRARAGAHVEVKPAPAPEGAPPAPAQMLRRAPVAGRAWVEASHEGADVLVSTAELPALPGHGVAPSIVEIAGLRLTQVNADLAAYFGPGSASGMLVLEADPRWAPVRAGDVILAIDGHATSEDGALAPPMPRRGTKVVLLRDGKQMVVETR